MRNLSTWLIILAVVVGLVWFGLFRDDEKAESSAAPATTTEAPTTSTTGPLDVISYVPGDLSAPTGSAAEFCDMAGTYDQAAGMLAAIAVAPNPDEAEVLAQKAVPLFNDLLAKSPAEVFDRVRELRFLVAPITLWSFSQSSEPGEPGSGALSDYEIRMDYLSILPKDPTPEGDVVVVFLRGCSGG